MPGIMAIIFLVITAGARGFREVVQNVYREYGNKGYVPSVLVDLFMCTSAVIFYEGMRRKERKRLEHLVEMNRQKRYAGLFGMENDLVKYLHEHGVHVREPRRDVNVILR